MASGEGMVHCLVVESSEATSSSRWDAANVVDHPFNWETCAGVGRALPLDRSNANSGPLDGLSLDSAHLAFVTLDVDLMSVIDVYLQDLNWLGLSKWLSFPDDNLTITCGIHRVIQLTKSFWRMDSSIAFNCRFWWSSTGSKFTNGQSLKRQSRRQPPTLAYVK
ncbi:hypothetical protein HPB47_017143 [Ixodes persulcatus]|uniref:Uncharacterized protein n=1 Tax=Ixodes persulcatus TaxID=34615 RepID=A0AC60QP34_IXOPE|nr:hypothetical protein HPB47_017143 [Ixodes persulcatus]